MRIAILVPRRAGDPHRDKVWAWVRAWWSEAFPEIPIVEGHHRDGLFNRSAAVNLAARQAEPWDLALIVDADVICDPDHVRQAMTLAAQEDRLVVPFTVRHNLNARGSHRIMAGERGPWESFVMADYFDQHSSVLAVPRSAWDTIGGMDESFSGWGMEDTAFAIAAITLVGPLLRLEGEVWHLWHPAPPERRGGRSVVANRARDALYKAALGDPAAIRSLQGGGA